MAVDLRLDIILRIYCFGGVSQVGSRSRYQRRYHILDLLL